MFYNVFATEDIEKVNGQLSMLQEANLAEKEAFEGALLMKKAELAKGPAEKLSLFKSGHEKLERAISSDTTNVEFRFLRLMIQENAPKILGYHHEMDQDSLYVITHIEELSPVVQEAIINYSQRSKVLKAEDLEEALNE